LRNDDDIAGIQLRGEDIAGVPRSRAPADDRPVRPDDKDLFAIGDVVGSAGAAEIPAGLLVGHKGKGGAVVDLPADQHEARSLGDGEHVAAAAGRR